METCARGNATEATVLKALVEREVNVLVPFGEGHPFDLVAFFPPTSILRIQCKTARVKGECVIFNSRSTDHGNGAGHYRGLADVFGVYCPEIDRVYLVPVRDVPTGGPYLRLYPTRNNQRRRVRFAADFEIDHWSDADLRALAANADGGPPGQAEFRPVAMVSG